MKSHIVLVDDDSINLKIATNILTKHEISVTPLGSGFELLDYLKSEIPDLILLDIMMPEMDGFETLTKIRVLEKERGLEEIPVVFLTSDETNESEARGFEMGVSDYIHKPFKADILIKRIENILNRQKLINHFHEEAIIDQLTGLLNKVATTDKIEMISSRKPGVLLMIDLDSFKLVNDIYGHAAGDEILIAFSSQLKKHLGTDDIIGRIGGDEFLILLDVTDEDDIHQIARNIRTGIQWSITNVDPESVVTCSMGIAKFPVNAQNYEDLFELADKSLYIAKYRGRNTYILYSPELHDKILIENKQIDDRVTSGKFFFDCVNSELEILNKIQKLDGSKKEAVYEVLNLMISYLQISKITIYDKDFKLLYLAGVDEVNSREDYVKRTSNYFKLFNEYSFLHLDNTNVLNSIDGDRYDLYRFTNISSTIEVLVKDKNCGNLLICYDLYKPARTFKKDKITFALLIARKLSEIL